MAIVRTYPDSLRRLSGVVERFIVCPERFANVFTEGSLTRARKSALRPCDSPDCQYIRDMQLETVLQRLCLQTIADRMAPDAKSVIVGETRGVALLDIKEPRGLPPFVEGECTFNWGLQFQGNPIKIQLESGCDAEGRWIPASRAMNRYLRDQVFGPIRDFVSRPRRGSDWKFNAPRNPGSAYCSSSRPNGQSCGRGSLAAAVESYSASLEEALVTAAELCDHLVNYR